MVVVRREKFVGLVTRGGEYEYGVCVRVAERFVVPC